MKQHEDINYMSVKEFRTNGFLQEANRLFFHPLGLALEVQIDEHDQETFGQIWDYRGDPEGIMFGSVVLDPMKVANVEYEAARHFTRRTNLFTPDTSAHSLFIVQPVTEG